MDRIEAEKIARRKRTTEEIAIALERSGLTRKEFAQKMHRVPSEVTRWLSGKHNFTSDLLAEISYILESPISGTDDITDIPCPIVEGYSISPDKTILSENAMSFYGNLDIPGEAVESLKAKARSKGLSLREYVKDILTNAAAEHSPSAADFCGIWSDDRYPDYDQILNYRTHNTFPEL